MSEYTYKEGPNTSGMWVKINCQIHHLREFKGTSFTAGRYLGLAFPRSWNVDPDMRSSFLYGLAYVAEAMQEKASQHLVIEVIELDYTPTDFQIEGLGYAIAGWVIQEYDLAITLPKVKYDKALNHYIYPYTIET